MSKDPSLEWGGLALIGQKQNAPSLEDDDAPLNLSMKPTPKSSGGGGGGSDVSSNNSNFSSTSPIPLNSNSLQSLTSITAAVGNNESRCKFNFSINF